MKISTRGRYGLKAMVDIASQSDGQISLKSVASRQGISESYLEQLIVPLKRAGLVTSIRGSKGGYITSRPADEISVREILLALEGSIAPVACLEGSENCHCGDTSCDPCVTKPVWEKIYESFNEVTGSITLAELVKTNPKESLA